MSDSDDDDEPLARRVSFSEDSQSDDDNVRKLKQTIFIFPTEIFLIKLPMISFIRRRLSSKDFLEVLCVDVMMTVSTVQWY